MFAVPVTLHTGTKQIPQKSRFLRNNKRKTRYGGRCVDKNITGGKELRVQNRDTSRINGVKYPGVSLSEM